MSNYHYRRPPRVYRRSLGLHAKLDGAPIRQPFLRHVYDDDFVAAYLGYDNVDDLNRLRLSNRNVSSLISFWPRLVDSRKGYSALRLIIEMLNTSYFKSKMTGFMTLMREPEGVLMREPESVLSLVDPFFVIILYAVTSTAPYLRNAVTSHVHKRQTIAQNFNSYMVSRRGIRLTTLPDYGPVLTAPRFMENEEDLEGLLRAAALLFSLEELTKPSVWRRRFPRTIDVGSSVDGGSNTDA